MISTPRLFTSFEISGWQPVRPTLALLLASFIASPATQTTAAEEDCPVTMSEALGADVVQQLRAEMEKLATTVRPHSGVVPQELAHTVNATLPLFRRCDLLKPVSGEPKILVDTPYGTDYTATSSDVHVLPSDPRVFCLLEPGLTIFLSDGGDLYHYANIDNVDLQRKVVTLFDPWASVSFLLPGHNFVDVKARAYSGAEGQPLLDLTFDEFLRALRGSVEWNKPEEFFETFEKVYPELARTEDYLVWRYTRLLASGDYSYSISTAVMKLSQEPIENMPRLRLVKQWADDYTIGVPSGFRILELGGSAKKADIPKLRQAFLDRIDDYAKTLPWPLKWLLLRQTAYTEDMRFRLAIIDGFLKADPKDVDFQITRAETLLQLGQVDQALHELESAETQWTSDVAHEIDKPTPAEAIAYFFAEGSGMNSLDVLHWRYQRIKLLSLITQLQRTPNASMDVENELNNLQGKYLIGSVPVDFFPYVLRLAYLAKNKGLEESFIEAAVEFPARISDVDKERLGGHFAFALYEHFTTRRSTDELSKTTLDSLRRSTVYDDLCETANGEPIIPDMQKRLTDRLASFCSLPKNTGKG
jgi:hypothetical protein